MNRGAFLSEYTPAESDPWGQVLISASATEDMPNPPLFLLKHRARSLSIPRLGVDTRGHIQIGVLGVGPRQCADALRKALEIRGSESLDRVFLMRNRAA